MLDGSGMSSAKAEVTQPNTNELNRVEHSGDTGSEISEHLSLNVPDMSAKPREYQFGVAILAVILLFYRGTGSGSDGGFTWGYSRLDNQVLKTSYVDHGQVSELVTEKTQSLSTLIKHIQERSSIPISELRRDSLFFANVDLTMSEPEWTFLIEHDFEKGTLALRFLRLPDGMDRSTTKLFGLIFSDLFKSIASGTKKTVAEVCDLVDREADQLWRWNTPVPQAIDKCVHEIFSQNAKKHPEKPAVISWDGELSYGQVEQLSSRLAAALLTLGVTMGTAIPLCFEKSIWTIVAVLGVIKAGGSLALTDPSQPEARLRIIAEEVSAKLVLASNQHAELASRIAPGATVMTVGPQLLQKMDDASSTISLPSVPPSTTLYIQFTSGSTGKPKGVIISHKNYTSGAIPRAKAVGYEPHSRVLNFPSYAFDVSFDCMLCTLAHGGCICEPSEQERMNDLNGAIKRMNVNMAHMTPSVARVLEPAVIESLEVLGLGGETVSASDASVWGRKTKLIIAYGPSECTVGCTINNSLDLNRKTLSIGRGVGGSPWIVDPEDHHRLMPIGAVGELLIEGPIVGDGYLNNPDLTASMFIQDPKWLVARGRRGKLYKTGDLVRYDYDGSGAIIFVGRADNQVKIRGQRVELGEIEYHLKTKLPANVRIAVEVITPKGGTKGDPFLVAFVVEEDNADTATQLGSFSPETRRCLTRMNEEIGGILPRYMVPTAYIPLTRMPLLVSMKTDRKTLRSIASNLSRQEISNFQALSDIEDRPLTRTEIKVSKAWKQLLGSDLELRLKDDFFTLGGDSLKAMRLVSLLRSEGISLTVRDIFTRPTLTDMALAAKSATDVNLGHDIPPFSLLPNGWTSEDAHVQVSKLCGLDESLVEDVYPCSPLQEALMALSAKITNAYVAQRVVRLRDTEDASRLKMAFDTVIFDQPVLRTRIVQVPERGLMQVVVKEKIPWNEGSDLETYLKTDRQKPMELGTALSRLAIICSETNTYFVWTIHHALYDGWSMPLVINRINHVYQGLDSVTPTPYKAFVRYLNGIDKNKALEYWRSELQGATGLQFPVVPQSNYQHKAQSLLEHYVPLAQSTIIGTTLATAIRGAWALVASEYSACNDVVFGETITGRNAPISGVDEIEGPLITTIPTRVHIDNRMSISQYLRSIWDQTVERIPFEHVGLQHIRQVSADALEACELRTGLVIHPKVDAVDKNAAPTDSPASRFVPADDTEAAREALKFNSYGLMLVFTLDDQGFLIMASFDSNMIDVPHMEQVLKRVGELVQELSSSPEKCIDELTCTTPNMDVLSQFSVIGPNSLARMVDEDFKTSLQGISRTWMVDPINSERLVPPGAVGELLLEGVVNNLPVIHDLPYWFARVPKARPGNHTKLYKSGQLARYRSDGSIALVKGRVNISTPRKRDHKVSIKATGKEKKMLRLWSSIIGIGEDEIDAQTSFFELGGSSISAMKLVSEAKSNNLKLTVAQIFDNRRFDRIVECAEDIQATDLKYEKYVPFSMVNTSDVKLFIENSVKPALSNTEWKISDVLPVRPLQKVAIDGTVRLPRFSVRYEAMYFNYGVDRDRLFKSCQDLVKENEILRTVFVKAGDEYLAVVLQSLHVPVFTYETEGDMEGFVHKVCGVDVETTMPFGSAFVKFIFIQGNEGRSCLIIRVSHAQYDEICLPVLLHQLSAFYEGRVVPRTVPFSFHVNHVIKENIPQSIPYWRNLLRGSSVSVLRPDTPLVDRQHTAVCKTMNISGRPSEVTVATLPTAAWAVCLARRLSVRDVVFGEVVSGRNVGLPFSDVVMGPCWQYVPFRVKFGAGWTALDLLRFVQEQHIASAPFEGIGISEVIQQCTDWPSATDWYDSVVHQDVEHVESLPFTSTRAEMKTIYPHEEPLREWKIQAFVRGDNLTLEVVTFESWRDMAVSLLEDLEAIVTQLANQPYSLLFE